MARFAVVGVDEQHVTVQTKRTARGRIDEMPLEHGLLRLFDQCIHPLIERLGRSRQAGRGRGGSRCALAAGRNGCLLRRAAAAHQQEHGARDHDDGGAEAEGHPADRSRAFRRRRRVRLIAEQRQPRTDFFTGIFQRLAEQRAGKRQSDVSHDLAMLHRQRPSARARSVVEGHHGKAGRVQIEFRERRGGLGLAARVPEHDARLAGRHAGQQLIDRVQLLENQVTAQIRADRGPKRVVAGDQKHVEFLLLESLDRALRLIGCRRLHVACCVGHFIRSLSRDRHSSDFVVRRPSFAYANVRVHWRQESANRRVRDMV